MSHIRVKAKYSSEEEFGLVREHYIYADHCSVSDTVAFYNEHGNKIFLIQDTVMNNMLATINTLYNPTKEGEAFVLKDGIEWWSDDDKKLCEDKMPESIITISDDKLIELILKRSDGSSVKRLINKEMLEC